MLLNEEELLDSFLLSERNSKLTNLNLLIYFQEGEDSKKRFDYLG